MPVLSLCLQDLPDPLGLPALQDHEASKARRECRAYLACRAMQEPKEQPAPLARRALMAPKVHRG
ncbi:hypothetical protein GCM10027044_13580 [Hymenobacter ruber]